MDLIITLFFNFKNFLFYLSPLLSFNPFFYLFPVKKNYKKYIIEFYNLKKKIILLIIIKKILKLFL